MQPLLKFIQWEDEIIFALELDLQVCRSDAQGIVDAQRLLVTKAWQAALTARQTANQIIPLCINTDTHNDSHEEYRHD